MSNQKQRSQSSPLYRADIDGLRGVAVLLVVGYHAFPSWIKSGFIGVDIFFVISGFLISSIIFKNLENGTFSYVNFYSRRINRILPALILILAFSFVFGWLALFADEYSELCKHILAGAGFVSNFVLWNETGYFDNAADTKPLLHLWSLGIEEQFYIFWPLTLGLLWKFRTNFLTVTILIALSSFAINLFTVLEYPQATFYSPVTRIWELMFGGILAYITLHKPGMIRSSHSQSLLGLAFIVSAALVLDKYKPFPSWWALLPTVGAAFIISAQPSAWLNRHVFSQRILVWIGLISYPLYLWHWPLLSFARIIEGGYASPITRIAALAVAILLAFVTYRWIERPIRFERNNDTSSIVLVSLLGLIGALGIFGFLRAGFPERLPDNLRNVTQLGTRFTASLIEDYQSNSTARKLFGADFRPDRDFFMADGEFEEAKILVVGDSHANRLYAGLSGIGVKKIANIGRGTCLPFINTETKTLLGTSNHCQPLFNNVFEYIKSNDKIEVVIITAFFNQYLDGRMTPTVRGGHADNSDIFMKQLNDTIKFLEKTGKKIVVVLDVPEIKICSVRRRFPITRSEQAEISNCTLNFSELESQSGPTIVHALRTSNHKNVRIFDPSVYLCNKKQCGNFSNQKFYLYDGNHLTIDGAKMIASHLLEVMN